MNFRLHINLKVILLLLLFNTLSLISSLKLGAVINLILEIRKIGEVLLLISYCVLLTIYISIERVFHISIICIRKGAYSWAGKFQ